MAPGDAARLYHELTSYSPEREWTVPIDDPRVVQGFVPNDFATWPAPCKSYPDGRPVVELPRTWPSVLDAAATAVLAGRTGGVAGRLDRPSLARLLHLSAGVVRVVEREDRPTLLLRAAGSAGGRFPLELYVSARGVADLHDGVYWYDPVGHALVRVGPSAAGEATTLVVTGVPWRTGWRYAERGFRHIYWDAGTMLSQALALAESAGLGPRLWTRFPDAEVSRLVAADTVHEFPVALLTLGDGAPAIRAQGEAAVGAVDVAPMEFPLVTQAQHAGDSDVLGEPWPAGAASSGASPASRDLDDVILQRGSTRLMDPAATVSREVFDFALAASLRGTNVPHFVAVHAVEGLEPGLYRWPDLDRPLRRGNLREELLRACWDQDLGRDAAFVVMAAIDIDHLDDRGYREAQLDAGLVEGRLHLAAYALGIGASGMTFLDSEIAGLLGEPLAGLLFTCVGVPTYRNKAGGRPGAAPSVVVPPAGLTLPDDPELQLGE
jgi:SagB-type dehydrogenase family enzyme